MDDPSVRERVARRGAFPRVSLETLLQKVAQVLGDALRQRRPLVVDDGEHRGHGLHVEVRRRAREQLQRNAPDGPHVRRESDLFLILSHLDRLGSHPVGRALHVQLGRRRVLLKGVFVVVVVFVFVSVSPQRHPEVGDLHDAVFGGEDVGALDVAVHDAARVQKREAPQELLDVHFRQSLRQRAELVRFHQRRQRAVLRELENHVHVLVVLHHAAKRNNVFVRAQFGEEVNLQTQRFARPIVQPLQSDLLHRHHRAVRGVDRLVHLAVRALADLLAENVRAHGGVPAGRLRELHRCELEARKPGRGGRRFGTEGGGAGREGSPADAPAPRPRCLEPTDPPVMRADPPARPSRARPRPGRRSQCGQFSDD